MLANGSVPPDQIRPPQRHRHHLRAAGLQRRAHQLVRREFPGPDHQPGPELATGNDQRLGHARRLPPIRQ